MHDASVGAGRLHIFRNGRHAVVGAERHDIISSAHLLVQVREKLAEVLVQAHKNVLNFAAAGAEFVAHVIHRRIADRKKIGSRGFSEIERVHGFLGEFRQGRVGVGARSPLLIEGVVRSCFSTEQVREGEVPSLGRNGTERLLTVPIGAYRECQSPGLAEVCFRRMRLSLLFDERQSAVGARGNPCAAVKPGGGIGSVSSHGDGRARLQRKRHDARSAAALKLQFFGKRGHRHAPGGVSAFRSGAGITNVLYARIRVFRAGHHALVLAVPPSVCDHSVGCGKCSGGNRGVAHASFRGGVGIGSVAEPRAFLDQTLEASGPLTEEFVHVVAAHLVDHQEYDQPGHFWRLRSCRAIAGRDAQNKRNAQKCRRHRGPPEQRARQEKGARNHVSCGLPKPAGRVYYGRYGSTIDDGIDRGAVSNDRITRPCASWKRAN